MWYFRGQRIMAPCKDAAARALQALPPKQGSGMGGDWAGLKLQIVLKCAGRFVAGLHAHVGYQITRRSYSLDMEANTLFPARTKDPRSLTSVRISPSFTATGREACARLGIRHLSRTAFVSLHLDFVVSKTVGEEVGAQVEDRTHPDQAAEQGGSERRLSVEANWCRSRPRVSCHTFASTHRICEQATPVHANIYAGMVPSSLRIRWATGVRFEAASRSI